MPTPKHPRAKRAQERRQQRRERVMRAMLAVMRDLDHDDAMQDAYGIDAECGAPFDVAFCRWREAGYPGA